MRDVHCRNNRDNNYQTKKLVDDVWWRFQERMDKGEDKEAVFAEAVDIALDRVENAGVGRPDAQVRGERLRVGLRAA